MIKITDIAFTCNPVSNVSRARAFYEEILGLKCTMEHEFAPGKWWIEYDIGAGTLAISNAVEPSGQPGPNIALEVEDFEAALKTVEEKKIPIVFGPCYDSPSCKFVLIADTEGNAINLHKHNH